MKIEIVRPNITFFSLPKMLTMGLFVSLILGALAWMWAELLGVASAKMVGGIIGVTWFFLALWSWWGWRARRRNGRWHRWLSSFVYVVYLSGYFWLVGVSFWGRVFVLPWNLVAIGLLFSLYVFVLFLPIINQNFAKKLYVLHKAIDRQIIGYGGIILIGIAGVVGYWIQKTLGRDFWMIIVSTLSPIVGLGLAQHQFFEIWQTRPWRKEEE